MDALSIQLPLKVTWAISHWGNSRNQCKTYTFKLWDFEGARGLRYLPPTLCQASLSLTNSMRWWRPGKPGVLHWVTKSWTQLNNWQPRDRHQQPLLPGVVHSLALLSCSSRVTGIAAFCSAGGKETRQWNANPGRQEGGGARWVIRTGGRRRWWRVCRATKHSGTFPLVLTRGAKANN